MRPGVAVAVESGGSLLVRADEEHVPAPARAAVAGGAGVGGGAHLVGSLAPVVLRELLEAGVAEGQHQLGAAGVAARRRAGAAVLRRLVAALVVDGGGAVGQVVARAAPAAGAALVARAVQPERLAGRDGLAHRHDAVLAFAVEEARAVQPKRLAIVHRVAHRRHALRARAAVLLEGADGLAARDGGGREPRPPADQHQQRQRPNRDDHRAPEKAAAWAACW